MKDQGSLASRIVGMQKLEALFRQKGYLICQASGVKIYDFDKVVAVFIPVDSTTDQIFAVHSDQAALFMQGCVSKYSNLI